MSDTKKGCTWVFTPMAFVHTCQLEAGHMGHHSFLLSSDEVMEASRKMAGGDEVTKAQLIAGNIFRRATRRLLGERDETIEALRARIRTLEGLLRRLLEWDMLKPYSTPGCAEVWPLADSVYWSGELKAALDGALGQANGHDDAAGSCPPKIEGA